MKKASFHHKTVRPRGAGKSGPASRPLRVVLPVLAALFVIGISVTLFAVAVSCQTLSKAFSEPSVSVDSVSLKGLNFSGADMLARIMVKNDNPVTIPFPETGWNLFVADKSFLSGTIKNDTKIAARSSTVVELPFTVSYEGLYKTASSLLDADEAPYRVDISARFPLPVLEGKTFTASRSGSLPMLKLPALSFNGVSFNSLSPAGVEFVLTWQVDNKNAFAFNLDKLDYGFTVNGKSWASGSAPRRLSLAARQTTRIPITVNINSASMIQEIVSLAAGSRAVNYTCTGEAALNPQGFENLAALKLPFTYSGSTTLRR